MRFRQFHTWSVDPETVRRHFESQQQCLELIKCSDGVYRPEDEVEAFEASVSKNLPAVIEQLDGKD